MGLSIISSTKETSTGQQITSNVVNDADPEEGEIIDDYEYILSSDEELNMRQRIKELEATNAELEKIAIINKDYTNYGQTTRNNSTYTSSLLPSTEENDIKNTRCGQLPSDVSSISSVEFNSPKKHKPRRSKTTKRKMVVEETREERYWHHHSHRHQNEHHHKKRRHNHRRNVESATHRHWEILSLPKYNHYSSSSDNSDMVLSISDDDEDGSINREELRFALARSNSRKCTTSSLMARLRKDHVHDANRTQQAMDLAKQETTKTETNSAEILQISEESDDSLEEKELRLIALKSAILKKHFARKKRDAEVAYSPTDFDNLLSVNDYDDNIDIVEEAELNDLHNAGMEISPVSSPKIINLDHEGDEELSNDVNAVNTKSVDMDIVSSESDVEFVGVSTDTSIPMPYNTSSLVTFNTFMLQIPPPFPGLPLYDEVPPPPPPYGISILSVEEINKRETESIKSLSISPMPDEKLAKDNTNHIEQTELIKKMGISEFSTNVESKKEVGDVNNSNENRVEDSDEEEEALRALLLAKIQSPINNRRKAKNKLKRDPLMASQKDNERTETEMCTHNEKPHRKKHAEEILKDAVKRLNNKISPMVHGPDEKNAEMPMEAMHLSDQPGLSTRLNHFESKENENTNVSLCTAENVQQIEKSVLTVKIVENGTTLSGNDENRILISNEKSALAEKHFESPTMNEPISANEEIASKTTNVPTQNPSAEMFNKIFNSHCTMQLKPTTAIPSKVIDISQRAKLTETTKKLANNTTTAVTTVSPLVHSSASVNKNYLSQVVLPIKKIVKRNKVINTNVQIKRTLAPLSNEAVHAKTKANNTFNSSTVKPNSACSSRLITSVDLPSLQVKKLVISLGPSDSEGDISHDDQSDQTQLPNNSTIDTAAFNLSNNYNFDNASPISLRMDSPIEPYTDDSSNRLIGAVVEAGIEKANTTFEQKLDSFLKNIRCQAEGPNSVATTATPKKISEPLRSASAGLITPLAVRHLPKTSQLEYRRLVHRMNLLQMRKQLKHSHVSTINPSKTTASTAASATGTATTTTTLTTLSPLAKGTAAAALTILSPSTTTVTMLTPKSPKSTTTLTPKSPKSTTTLTPKSSSTTTVAAAIGGTNNSSSLTTSAKTLQAASSPAKMASTEKSSTSKTKIAKMKVLRAYESSYKKIGAGILCNLEKSLQLTEVAKKTKVTKLCHERRLKQLQVQMDNVRRKYKQELQRMSKLFPAICGANEIITALKQRRAKLLKCATSLGKAVLGDGYRLNNDLKQEIAVKTAKLAQKIKLVNSLKCRDLDTMKNARTLTISRTAAITRAKSKYFNAGTRKKSERQQTTSLSSTRRFLRDIHKKEQQQPNDRKCRYTKQFRTLGEHEPRYQEGRKEARPKVLTEYVSPLLCTKDCNETSSKSDSNSVVCPFELFGGCEDENCVYMHLELESLENKKLML